MTQPLDAELMQQIISVLATADPDLLDAFLENAVGVDDHWWDESDNTLMIVVTRTA